MAVNSKEAYPLPQRHGDKTNPSSDWITINQFPGFLFSLSTQVGHNNSTIFSVILSPKGVAWVQKFTPINHLLRWWVGKSLYEIL
jgi:hypothetical protein